MVCQGPDPEGLEGLDMVISLAGSVEFKLEG